MGKPKRDFESYMRYIRHWENHFSGAFSVVDVPATGGTWILPKERYALEPLKITTDVDDSLDYYPDKVFYGGKLTQLMITFHFYNN